MRSLRRNDKELINFKHNRLKNENIKIRIFKNDGKANKLVFSLCVYSKCMHRKICSNHTTDM